MEQVVTNLVGNAVEAVGSRGKVRVETRPRAGGVVLVVGDNGPGIPPEVQPRVFEPFFTTKKRGNGLGLAICRQIVVSHGGTIEFASSPGKGTVFTVELPAAACGCSEPCNHPAAAFYPSI
jgi:signal transduction histidine kinase